MSTAIQPTRPQGAPLTQASPFWNSADEALVRSMCASKATPEEWKLFLYMANLYRLDPLIKQIYCVKYGTQAASIFASRDGFLAIAQRENRLNGIQTTCRVEPIPFTVTFWDNDLKQHVDVTKPTQIVATSTAWGKGMDHPIVVEVWEEEYSTGRNLWVTKRRTMTAKVAECQALRRIAGISGLYDRDEMGNDAMRAEVMDVEAREVDSATGEITSAPAPQRTERPATVAGVQSPAPSAPAASQASTAPPAGDAMQQVTDALRAIRETLQLTDGETLDILKERVTRRHDRLGQATLDERRTLLKILETEGRAALPDYATAGAV